ncbi:MAG: bifunctional hydroxymethylpyrimidine kinase/phosphomethylpyrimidine kinase [Lapillicoccus sp.]
MTAASTRVPVMLTIAGSDSSGGAGIQADLKTAVAFGVYGASVVTALTAQNTLGVHGILPVTPAFVVAQYEAVVTDLDVRAVKIGMLGDAALVGAVADMLQRHPVPAVVLDPVMVATSGDRLVPDEAVEAIRTRLLPLATVVTPNRPEAEALTGVRVGDADGMTRAAHALLALGAGAVLVKGGHSDGDDADDLLVSAEGEQWFRARRVDTAHTHGTGCTLSSAVAAGLARGASLPDAVATAKAYLTRALESGALQTVGAGPGPVDHLVDQRGSS